MTTHAETVVRQAYHAAAGDVRDIEGFTDLFTADGVFNAGVESYSGEHLTDLIVRLAKVIPDINRDLHRALGDVVAVELSIRGTFTGQPFPTPGGLIQPTGAKFDIPCADFWYLEDGKVKVFNCHISTMVMLAQLGVQPDFASAVAASAPADS